MHSLLLTLPLRCTRHHTHRLRLTCSLPKHGLPLRTLCTLLEAHTSYISRHARAHTHTLVMVVHTPTLTRVREPVFSPTINPHVLTVHSRGLAPHPLYWLVHLVSVIPDPACKPLLGCMLMSRPCSQEPLGSGEEDHSGEDGHPQLQATHPDLLGFFLVHSAPSCP